MILSNVNLVDSEAPVNIRIGNGKITEISHSAFPVNADPFHLRFTDALVFPGLINSHDHLDFNLFPQFGDRYYNNYTEWGKYIHTEFKSEISDILKIPKALRYEWGIYKNLLCGVTTVVNHGEKTGLDDSLITVFEETHCLHSVQFEKNWKLKLNNPLKIKLPVNIHVGEGNDWLSFSEINELLRYNLFRKKLIGVHAVAMSAEQAEKFEAIVWCPGSNYFLLNKTAQVDVLEKHTKILFGTDSALTSTWNIWEHLRLAKETRLLSDETLYASLTNNPAETWQLNTGIISQGKDADLVIAKPQDNKPGLAGFFSLTPADILLVIHKGGIRLFDESLLPQLSEINLGNYSRIFINNTCKYVQGDLPGLMQKIKEHQPDINFPVELNELVQL